MIAKKGGKICVERLILRLIIWYRYRCCHSGIVKEVAWSPDGKHITSGSDDKLGQVWRVP